MREKKKNTCLFKSRSFSRRSFFKKNIIITGSHGKTTTTSLVSKILSDQKLDPTIINGGVINSFLKVTLNLVKENGLF